VILTYLRLTGIEAGYGYTDKGSDSKESEFVSALDDLFLTRVINKETYRKMENHTGSILDLVITDSIERVLEWEISPPLGDLTFGHSVITWKYAVEKEVSGIGENRKKLNFKKGNYEGINIEFNSVDWVQVFHEKGVNECYEIFLDKYESVCEKFIPVCKKRKRKEAKWMTDELRVQVKKKRTAWYRMKSYYTSVTKAEYKKVCKELKVMIKKAVYQYEMKLAGNAKSDPKVIYSYVKSKQSVKEQVRALRNSEGELVTERQEVAEVLNRQFK
jgi:hypothetical protein